MPNLNPLDPFKGMMEQAIYAFASFLLHSAGWCFQQIWTWVTAPSCSNSGGCGAGWFQGLYGQMVTIAVWLFGLFLLLAVLQALWRGDLAMLADTVIRYLPAAILATAGLVAFTLFLMTIVDELSSFLIGHAAVEASSWWQDASSKTNTFADHIATDTQGQFLAMIAIVLAILVVLLTLFVGLELLARMAFIYLLLMFLPLFFAAMVWPWARGLARRGVELLVGMVLLKFVIVAILVMAGSAVTGSALQVTGVGPQSEPAIVSLLMGMVMLAVASASPWILARLIPMVETVATEHFHRPHQQLHPVASKGWSLAKETRRWYRETSMRAGGAGMAGAGASAATGIGLGLTALAVTKGMADRAAQPFREQASETSQPRPGTPGMDAVKPPQSTSLSVQPRPGAPGGSTLTPPPPPSSPPPPPPTRPPAPPPARPPTPDDPTVGRSLSPPKT